MKKSKAQSVKDAKGTNGGLSRNVTSDLASVEKRNRAMSECPKVASTHASQVPSQDWWEQELARFYKETNIGKTTGTTYSKQITRLFERCKAQHKKELAELKAWTKKYAEDLYNCAQIELLNEFLNEKDLHDFGQYSNSQGYDLLVRKIFALKKKLEERK